MKIIQELLENTLRNQLTVKRLCVKAVEYRLQQLGLKLSKNQKKKLLSKVEKGDLNNLSFRFDDSKISDETLLNQAKNSSKISLDFGDIDTFIHEFTGKIEGNIADMIPRMIQQLGNILTKPLLKKVKRLLQNSKSEIKDYEGFITNRWGKALDLLETMVIISNEIGEDLINEFCSDMKFKSNLIEAETRLYARACQVSNEILTLLKRGYADGAHARWRSLHEISVVMFFLTSFGEEIAEQYLLHEAIESYKAAIQYQDYCNQLGYEPLTQSEMNKFKFDRDQLIERFGKNYNEEYGWASNILGIARPRFLDIEKKIGLEHMRPFYKIASDNVHANPKGVFFKLGVFSGGPDFLLAGPSPLGLADPGQCTALSISLANTAILTIEANMDMLVFCSIMRNFSDLTVKSFVEAHCSIEKSVKT